MIELEREHLLALVQTDSQLSEVIMRAFILRRVELIARGYGDAVLLGSTHSPGTLRIKEFLTETITPTLTSTSTGIPAFRIVRHFLSDRAGTTSRRLDVDSTSAHSVI